MWLALTVAPPAVFFLLAGVLEIWRPKGGDAVDGKEAGDKPAAALEPYTDVRVHVDTVPPARG